MTRTLRSSALVLFGLTACGPRDESPGAASLLDAADLNLQPDEIAIEYIAHASFRLHSADGSKILIDPFASRIWLGYDFPDTLATDAILISHPHYDHDAGQYRDMPFPWDSTVPVFTDPGTYAVGEFTIHGIEGKHADPYGMEFGQINTIWLIEIGGVRIVHLGDNGPITDANIQALGRVDVLMIPVDARYHILKEVEIQAIRRALQPRIIVPMHYRLPDLEASDDSPSDLGEIRPWLTGRENVRGVGRHIEILEAATLPSDEEIVVLDHSPAVTRPDSTVN